MFSTLSLATILATQDRPVQGTFGLPTSFFWARNLSDGNTFVINRPETGLATVMTGSSLNRRNFGLMYLSLLVNGTYYPFWFHTGAPRAVQIELKNGTYRHDAPSQTPGIVTFHGHYTQRVASTTSQRDPWLTTDRLWQHFSPRDGDTFNVTDAKTVMTYIGNCALQRKSGSNFVSIYNLPQSYSIYPMPGVVLVPGEYRLQPFVDPTGNSLVRDVLLVGGYKAP